MRAEREGVDLGGTYAFLAFGGMRVVLPLRYSCHCRCGCKGTAPLKEKQKTKLVVYGALKVEECMDRGARACVRGVTDDAVLSFVVEYAADKLHG